MTAVSPPEAVRCPHCGDLLTKYSAPYHIERCKGWAQTYARIGLVPEIRAVQEACTAIREGLEWRGPSGKKLGHIVLTREQACALIGYEDKKGI